MLNSHPVFYLDLTADELVISLLGLAESEPVCILDSSGVEHLGSHLLVAGLDQVSIELHQSDEIPKTLTALDVHLTGHLAAVFTLSYEFGCKLIGLGPSADVSEPDLFVSTFDVLIIHDYQNSTTRLSGNAEKFPTIAAKLLGSKNATRQRKTDPAIVRSSFTKRGYLDAIDQIKEKIRSGDTYQTNLTQRLTAELAEGLSAGSIFDRIRKQHPAPFAAYIDRSDSKVVSASPERFFRIVDGGIDTSPIKGTRPRGKTTRDDINLREELISSTKDRAENTMIVDLLRNDLGRVCEYGTVRVEKLCDLEEHPSLFHLVSTISGTIRTGVMPSEVIKALFPCGSITGAPKISTMKIIEELEHSPRGLSMGAIGLYIPPERFDLPPRIDTSVAIRTMVIRGRKATFNVGGGIVIDSEPQAEYEESLTKASALLNAINGRLVAG